MVLKPLAHLRHFIQIYLLKISSKPQGKCSLLSLLNSKIQLHTRKRYQNQCRSRLVDLLKSLYLSCIIISLTAIFLIYLCSFYVNRIYYVLTIVSYIVIDCDFLSFLLLFIVLGFKIIIIIIVPFLLPLLFLVEFNVYYTKRTTTAIYYFVFLQTTLLLLPK